MNTYKKYCPNVFVAQCEEQHEKGSEIVLTTKYGKEHECIAHNYLGKTKDGLFLYSITRSDGFNAQERAKNKADRLNEYANSAEKRSDEAFKQSDLSEDATGIPFGQPILVGHHSERRHRKVIERAENAMRKSIAESEKAEEYRRRAEYWENKSSTINLSMPESLGYFEFKLEEAKRKHQYLKDNPDKRAHSMSLQYANKDVREVEKNLQLAVKLWGSEEEINQINKEEEEKTKEKLSKKKGFDSLIAEYGGFFHFGSDVEEFKRKYNELLKNGYVDEGEKVCHIVGGLYVPVKNKSHFVNRL